MQKNQLMPKVMVYSGVLDNTEFISSTIKQSETVKNLLCNGRIVRDALVRAESAGAGLAALIGDFNATFCELPCAFSLTLAGWQDLHQAGACFVMGGSRRD